MRDCSRFYGAKSFEGGFFCWGFFVLPYVYGQTNLYDPFNPLNTPSNLYLPGSTPTNLIAPPTLNLIPPITIERSNFEKLSKVMQKFLEDHLFIDEVPESDILEISKIITDEFIGKLKFEKTTLQFSFEKSLDSQGLFKVSDNFWQLWENLDNEKLVIQKSLVEILTLAVKKIKTPEDDRRGRFELEKLNQLLMGTTNIFMRKIESYFSNPKANEIFSKCSACLQADELQIRDALKVIALRDGGYELAVSRLRGRILDKIRAGLGESFSQKKISITLLDKAVDFLDSHGSIDEDFTSAPAVQNFFQNGASPFGAFEFRKAMTNIYSDTFEFGKMEVPDLEEKPVSLSILKFHAFHCVSEPCYLFFESQLKEAQDDVSSQGLVIDLRNNPGGYVDLLDHVLDFFIGKKGTLLYTTWDCKGNKVADVLDGEKYVYRKPIVILINRHSASAAEFFTSVMKYQGRAIVFGEDRSYGKAIVMTSGGGRSPDFTSLLSGEKDIAKATRSVAVASLPNGYSHQMKGVSPDLEFPGYFQLTRTGEEFLKRSLGAQPSRVSDAVKPKGVLESAIEMIPNYFNAYFIQKYKPLIQSTLESHRVALVTDLGKLGGKVLEASDPGLYSIHQEWGPRTVESVELQYKMAAQYFTFFREALAASK